MGLVDDHVGAVLLADVDELAQRRAVAQHRIDAFQHTTRLPGRSPSRRARLQARRIVVLEAHDLGLRHLAGIVDRGVAVGVDQQLVALAREGSRSGRDWLIAGREDHAVFLP